MSGKPALAAVASRVGAARQEGRRPVMASMQASTKRPQFQRASSKGRRSASRSTAASRAGQSGSRFTGAAA